MVGTAQAVCPPAGESKASLQALAAVQWRLPGAEADATSQVLALGLADCLADADPVLRDELAFGALQSWMRSRQLAVPTVQALRTRLLAVLDEPASEPGFAQPFAALTLAEVARVDRLQPFLAAEEREQLVARAARYLAGVRDYRGYDAQAGWRHGVAHGADLALQLSLNPQLQKAQAEQLLAAVAAQVAPAGEHFYRYGEGGRLAAPVFYLARRGWWSAPEWEAWFAQLSAGLPARGPASQAGLARSHNQGAFLSALYVALQENADGPVKERLLPGLRKALQALD